MAIGPEHEPSSRQPILFNRLMCTLQNRLHESDLSPLSVAGELGNPTRTVHYAFARAGTTFVQRLMELRLGRPRDLLRNVRLYDLPVTEVAARCGFADPSHSPGASVAASASHRCNSALQPSRRSIDLTCCKPPRPGSIWIPNRADGMQCCGPGGRFALWDWKYALRSAHGYAMEGRLYPTVKRHCPND